MARYLPRLRTWASGRLPGRSRSLLETGDLVQEALLRTLKGLDRIQVRGRGGFQAYVRAAILNRIRDEIRWSARRPGPDGVPESLESREPSPMEMAIGADLTARYDRALATLTQTEQELLHLKVELDCDYDEIAAIANRPNREAARAAVARALRRLAEALGEPA
jgi:RNA polymerase sigma factor (sigma-70 family)